MVFFQIIIVIINYYYNDLYLNPFKLAYEHTLNVPKLP